MSARSKAVAATLAAAFAAGCGGSGHAAKSDPDASARTSPPRHAAPAGPPTKGETARRLLGLPAVPDRPPVPGYVMIADRENNRIVVVSPRKRVVWTFPGPHDLRSGQSFAGPDDAFLTPDGRGIITNEEFQETIALIRLAKRPRVVFEYGHSGVAGSGPGYLSHPDDAYLLPNGLISVADIVNCRVIYLKRSGRIVRSIGSAGNCTHDPPRSLSSPNGDTPLPDGGVLVTEIGGYVDRIDRHGHLRWSIHTPTSYPSDAQLLGNGNVLVAGFDDPGHIYVITPKGRVVWTYGPSGGHGMLNKPSLAVPFPHGLIAATDDYGQRVVVIDPRSKKIVWEYGHLDQPGSAPGYLNKPDGLDLIRSAG